MTPAGLCAACTALVLGVQQQGSVIQTGDEASTIHTVTENWRLGHPPGELGDSSILLTSSTLWWLGTWGSLPDMGSTAPG